MHVFADSRTVVSTAWLRVRAFDPGLAGLRLAVRAVGAVAVAIAIVYAIDRWNGQPITEVIVAGALALFSTLVINEPNRRAQAITMAWAPLPAMASLTVGALLAAHPGIAHSVFVVIIFLAVWVRRFGSRGFALGMLSFLAYFFALFLQPPPAALPWFHASIVVGVGSAALWRIVLLPEDPERVATRMLASFHALADRLLADAEDRAARGEPGPRMARRLRRRLLRVNATALGVESLLEHFDEIQQQTVGITASSLFDLELAIEQVALRIASLAPDQRRPARRSLRILRRCLRARMPPPDNVLKGLDDDLDRETDGGLWGLADEVRRLYGRAASWRFERSTIDDADTTPGTSGSADNPEERASGSARLLDRIASRLRTDVALRQAIQASLAGALALALGQWLAPDRWYWAAVTAFIVFTGTTNRGDVLFKGTQRVLGTLTGVIAGVALAALVHGEPRVQLAIIFVCIFFGAFFLRRSYTLMIFAITILVAMLYGMLGFFSTELLGLRIAETVIGAAAGMGVATVVLPTSTRRHVRDASIDTLTTLADLIEACGADANAAEHQRLLTRQSRALDDRAQTLRAAAQPLLRATTGMFSRRGARRWLRALWAARHYSRTLVHLSLSRDWYASPEWRSATAAVACKFRILAGDDSSRSRAEAADDAVSMPELRSGHQSSSDVNARGVTALQRLDRIATRLLALRMRQLRYSGLPDQIQGSNDKAATTRQQ